MSSHLFFLHLAWPVLLKVDRRHKDMHTLLKVQQANKTQQWANDYNDFDKDTVVGQKLWNKIIQIDKSTTCLTTIEL